MNSKCPKCSSDILIEPVKISDNGTEVKCPECKSRLYLFKESFAGRALYKSGEIYCSICASKLDHTIVCPECKALYPDYFVVRSTKKVRVRSANIPKSFTSLRTSTPSRKSRTPSPLRKEKVHSQRSFKVLGSVIALVSLVLGGVYAFNQYANAKQYTLNYMRALYGIKTGTDTCEMITRDLKTKVVTQGVSSVNISTEDEVRLVGLKDRVDKLMSQIESPPSKFIKSDKQIKDLYVIYSSLNSLTLAPVGSPENFIRSTSKLQEDFSEGFKELKADMPPKLSEVFKTAQIKYKNLRDI